MKPLRWSRLAILVCTVSSPCVFAETFTSVGSGTWHPTNPDNIWSPAGNPLPGDDDDAIIDGHTVIFGNNLADATAGLPGSNDLGVSNGNQITINNGGVLSQQQTGWWVRIGHSGLGTLNINDGRFHFTDGTGGGSNLQVGVQDAGSEGRINIGDGTGGDNSAILNLRDRINGDGTGGTNNMNLGASTDTFGIVTIHSDGLLEGDAITRSGGTINQNPHIRVGQSSSTSQSVLRVNAGGPANVRGNFEVGAGGGAQGLVHLTGAGARLDQYDGDFTVGFNGTGNMVIEDGASFTRHNNAEARMDMFVGRGGGTGTITIRDGGEFIQGAGGNVGDLRIGFGNGATGILNVEEGGLFRNDSGNWNWVGQNEGSTGVINVIGGEYRITTGSNLNIGQNGNGTFHQTSGTSEVNAVLMAENNGTANFELEGGTFTSRGGFLMAGTSTGSSGTGTANGLQTDGTLNVGGALVVGLAANHTATYTLSGGVINHTGSDISIGESGTGTMTIGAGATLNDTSTTGGAFFVGRNEGSSGTLWVDGTLVHASTSAVRVGNGNTNGVDNTNATGILGGSGTIESLLGGVRIGTHGTLTGGTLNSTGTLEIAGNLEFSSGGSFFANIEAGGTSDTIQLTGTLDISGAVLGGTVTGGPVAFDNRYWLIINDGVDAITGGFANLDGSSTSGAFADADGWITMDGQEFAVYYSGDFATNSLTGGNDLVLTAVPEPGSLALTGVAFALGLLRRRRPAA